MPTIMEIFLHSIFYLNSFEDSANSRALSFSSTASFSIDSSCDARFITCEILSMTSPLTSSNSFYSSAVLLVNFLTLFILFWMIGANSRSNCSFDANFTASSE